MGNQFENVVARAREVLASQGWIDVEKTIWASAAGKKSIADRLAKLLPPHGTYVEPFAGSAAVLFAKQPVATEVISDLNPDVTKAYRVIKRLKQKDIARLESCKWVGDKATFDRIKKEAPTDDVGWIHRFLYLTNFSYGKMGKNFSPGAAGVEARSVKRIRDFAPRLARVKVLSGDYEPVIRKYDGKDTVFFLDPPYVGYNAMVGENRFDEGRFVKMLKNLKGQFLLTYGIRTELAKQLEDAGFNVQRIRTRRRISYAPGTGGAEVLTQILASNYDLARKCLDELDEDDWEFEKAAWSRAFIDELPDSAFLHIESGGKKDGKGKTVPRSFRHFPVRGADGKVDVPHLRNAIARIPQAKIPGLSEKDLQGLQDKARRLLEETHRFAKSATLIKGLDPSDERFVLGIVLEPEVVDAQGDIYSAEEIRQAAHKFMEDFGGLGLMHRYRVNDQVKIAESYLAPGDFSIGEQMVRKGTWLLGVHVLSDELWGEVKDGSLSGFSIGGTAVRNPETSVMRSGEADTQNETPKEAPNAEG